MSGYKKFAVAGAGNFGKFIVKELLQLKNEGTTSSVSVLTRSASNANSTELAELGVKVVEVDYESADSISKALTGVHVLICAFGVMGLATQKLLAEPAKQAGVKLFIPSEYGGDNEEMKRIPFYPLKLDVQKKLENIGLPYTLFQTGGWPETFFTTFFDFDLTNGKVKLGGQGDAPISFTSIFDAARFIAHALVYFPNDKLEWKTLRIEGDRQTVNAVLAQYEERKGIKLDITRSTREELEANIKANPGDILSIFRLAFDLGGAHLEGLANEEWPEWNPKRVIDVIA